ncbi:MAG: hypothetical protein KC609_12375, partial [Myxococcales bacterium]|nr:hypothetical protein [Myxococcales bacterium]
ASPITLTVNVADAPTGNLEVALKYDAPVQLAKIKLILLEGNYICNNLVPTQPPTDVLADQTALSTSDKTKFNNLAVGVNFTVFATGFRADNQLVAAGCLDGLFVQEGETTKVTLTLYILSLDVVGVYDMIGHFNFVNAIPGKLGDVIKQIVLAVEDPGQFLIDLAQTVLQQWLGILGTALNVVIDLVEDYISDWLTNQIQNIGFLKPVFDALSQITNLITNLEIEYTLSFSKLSNDFLVRGTEIWHTINFWWKFGCDKNAPDYDTCGTKFSLSMNALQSPDLAYPLDIIKGEFVGSIVNFDQLNIERHTINLHYGKLIVYVINNILLPKITGDPSITSLSALVKSLIDCDKFAEDVAGSVSGIPFFGDISEGALKSLCTAGEGLLSFLGTLLTSFVDQLALDTRLRVQGTCTLVDTDNDLLVDKIINGTYDGNIEYEGSQGNNFSGTFSGDRKTAP